MATLNNICNKNPVFPNKNGHTFWIIRSYFQASKVILSHTFQQLKFIRNPVIPLFNTVEYNYLKTLGLGRQSLPNEKKRGVRGAEPPNKNNKNKFYFNQKTKKTGGAGGGATRIKTIKNKFYFNQKTKKRGVRGAEPPD